ncbi:MAG: Ig-like domain-containing protein [Myxococcota bacterium]
MNAVYRPVWILSLGLFGCSELSFPSEFFVECETDADCPSGFECRPLTRSCAARNSETVEPTRPELAFSSPANGETAVPVNQAIIIAFSLDVQLSSLTDRIRLLNAANESVPIRIESTPDALNIFRLVPEADLSEITSYEVVIDPGVEPIEARVTAASNVAFRIAFDTALAPDVTPPAAVSDIRIDHFSASAIQLQWTNPLDSDFAGVLIVRREAGALLADEGPVSGVTYAIGATLGAENEARVIGVTTETTWTDVTVTDAQYDYGFYAFDTVNNYAPLARVPFVSSTTFTWCPDETGTFSVDSPDAGTQQILLALDSITTPFQATGFPATPDAIGTTGFSSTDFSPGVEYFARYVVSNDRGSYAGPERRFWVSRGVLPATTGGVVSLGGTASLSFEPDGWTAFEGEVDTDSSETESYVASDVNSLSVMLPILAPGNYRLRVRPVEAGCAIPAPWTTSDPIDVGSFLYVRPGGSGTMTGDTPANALASLVEAASMATAQTEVRVMEGAYAETATIQVGTTGRWRGGYDATFTTRDPLNLRSVVRVGASPAVRFENTEGAIPRLFEGFDVAVTSAGGGVALDVTEKAGPIVRENTLWRGEGATSSFTVSVTSAGEPTLEFNTILGRRGVSISGASATIQGNTFSNPSSAEPAAPGSAAVNCGSSFRTTVIGNVFELEDSAILATSACAELEVRGNALRAGDGAAIILQSSTATVSNNTIYAFSALSEGVAVDDAAPLLVNNTFVGNPAVRMTGALARPFLVNNLFVELEPSDPWALLEGNSVGPSALQGNVLVVDGVGILSDSTHGVLNTLADVEGLLCGASSGVLQNSELASATNTLESLFVDPDGPDDVLSTLGDNDLRLLTDDPVLTAGGVDAGSDVCGGSSCSGLGSDPCGSVVFDGAEVSRTVPYSVGAFEKD